MYEVQFSAAFRGREPIWWVKDAQRSTHAVRGSTDVARL